MHSANCKHVLLSQIRLWGPAWYLMTFYHIWACRFFKQERQHQATRKVHKQWASEPGQCAPVPVWFQLASHLYIRGGTSDRLLPQISFSSSTKQHISWTTAPSKHSLKRTPELSSRMTSLPGTEKQLKQREIASWDLSASCNKSGEKSE